MRRVHAPQPYCETANSASHSHASGRYDSLAKGKISCRGVCRGKSVWRRRGLETGSMRAVGRQEVPLMADRLWVCDYCPYAA